MDLADVIVVGSGPSGSHAAAQAVRDGLRTVMLDVGVDAPAQRDLVPSKTFSELRRTDEGQRAYFLGSAWNSDENDGPHLTPPREYVTRDARARLPVVSDTFFPVQSLALGGLGAGWGAGSVTFERFELEEAGLPADEIATYYDDVIAEVGVSGVPEDDIAPYVMSAAGLQPGAEIDTNARTILSAYERRRERLKGCGFTLGRPPLALLTRPIGSGARVREANPYTDMDFYGDSGGSIYRPRFTIERLRDDPRFRYVDSALVQTVVQEGDRVRVVFRDSAGAQHTFEARRVILAAGALNTARIVLQSRALAGVRLPLLCNTMSYLVTVNARMLGRVASDRRHSLAQLLAINAPVHRKGQRVVGSFYSYRSLLNFRLVDQLPFAPSLGLLASRALSTSLTIVGVHHPEIGSSRKWIELADAKAGILRAEYEVDSEERRALRMDLDLFERFLRVIGCFTVRRMETRPGASIHYGGTIPRSSDGSAPVAADDRGRLVGSPRVYLADSSTWKALPAKGLTLTLMANARRVAAQAALDTRNEDA